MLRHEKFPRDYHQGIHVPGCLNHGDNAGYCIAQCGDGQSPGGHSRGYPAEEKPKPVVVASKSSIRPINLRIF
jgi:hypothetical protein